VASASKVVARGSDAQSCINFEVRALDWMHSPLELSQQLRVGVNDPLNASLHGFHATATRTEANGHAPFAASKIFTSATVLISHRASMEKLCHDTNWAKLRFQISALN